MLANSYPPSISNNQINFSFGANKTQRAILQYMRNWLPGFLVWSGNDFTSKTHEDDISGELERFLQSQMKSTDLVFNLDRKKGSDFRVWVDGMGINTLPIFLIEAKRLEPTSTRDYVHYRGKPGGISRFKLEQTGFGDHLTACAMLGYIQKRDFSHWFVKVNSWVSDLITGIENSDGMSWKTRDQLVEISQTTSIAEYRSEHARITKNPIYLTHFWLNLDCQ